MASARRERGGAITDEEKGETSIGEYKGREGVAGGDETDEGSSSTGTTYDDDPDDDAATTSSGDTAGEWPERCRRMCMTRTTRHAYTLAASKTGALELRALDIRGSSAFSLGEVALGVEDDEAVEMRLAPNDVTLALFNRSAMFLQPLPMLDTMDVGDVETSLDEGVQVGKGVFSSRNPIIDVQWYPAAPEHVAVLSPGCFRLYSVANVSMVLLEYKFEADVEMVGFAFGAARSWEQFTVFLLGADGSVFSISPVVPHMCRVTSETIAEMMSTARAVASSEDTPEDVKAAHVLQYRWLEGAWTKEGPGAYWSVFNAKWRHSALSKPGGPPVAPCLQGPFPTVPKVPIPADQVPQAVIVSPAATCEFAALTVAWSGGIVRTLISVEPIVPMWSEMELAEWPTLGRFPAPTSEEEDGAAEAPTWDSGLSPWIVADSIYALAGTRGTIFDLLHDAWMPEVAYIVHSEGVNMLSLSWLRDVHTIIEGRDVASGSGRGYVVQVGETGGRAVGVGVTRCVGSQPSLVVMEEVGSGELREMRVRLFDLCEALAYRPVDDDDDDDSLDDDKLAEFALASKVSLKGLKTPIEVHEDQPLVHALYACARDFQEKRITPMLKIRAKIEAKAESLRELAKGQTETLDKLKADLSDLSPALSKSLQRMRALKTMGDNFQQRIQRLLVVLSLRNNKPTKAEREFAEELEQMDRSIDVHMNPEIGKLKDTVSRMRARTRDSGPAAPWVPRDEVLQLKVQLSKTTSLIESTKSKLDRAKEAMTEIRDSKGAAKK